MLLQNAYEPEGKQSMAIPDLSSEIAVGQTGQGKLIQLPPGSGAHPLGGWAYVPAFVNPDARPLVAVHGISRRAKQQVQLLAAAADRTGRVVIAPLFGRRHWRRYQRIANNCRADRALLDLLARVDMQGIARTNRFDLFGYSGGAQFAHRFAMLFPRRIGRLSLAAAGWYCMPDTDKAYPYGLAARAGRKADWGPRMLAGLDAYLRLPITVYVGANDTDRDTALRRSPHLDGAQGANRFERARRYHASLSELAQVHAIRSRISFTVLPDSHHSFSRCVKTGGLDRLVLG